MRRSMVVEREVGRDGGMEAGREEMEDATHLLSRGEGLAVPRKLLGLVRLVLVATKNGCSSFRGDDPEIGTR